MGTLYPLDGLGLVCFNVIMKKLFLLLFFITGFSSSQTWGADFEKGLVAALSGDYATALKEWTPLAEQGDTFVQYDLGVMYERGVGVPQDYKTAVKWYTLSAEQGYATAQTNLGQMYRNGLGVLQDYKTAVKWFTRASEQGDAHAQTKLAAMISLGEGVIQDNVYAHMWLNISRANGHKNGNKLIEILVKKMTPSQIEKAQDLARECVKKNYKGC
tara:strand:- start:795 stop:1439 length:645 start_codon:yes stop_codon:yes gene_type:complete